jgi:alpha-tubulin suppressor-like RCC1 family protein
MPNQFTSPDGDLENYFISESWLIDQYVGDTLWIWGSNAGGQLGINSGIRTMVCTPVTTSAGGTNWKQISGGFFHTSAIKTDGTLWIWGDNAFGALGINNITQGRACTPVTTFLGGTNWKQVSGGGYHTVAIKTDGTLWAWGFNNFGQLGTNNTTNTTRSIPVTTFLGGTNWKSVDCGINHTAAIKTDGTLWVWGRNGYGQLGTNDTANRGIPVQTFLGGTNWKSVAGGGSHTVAIKTDGTLWTWGLNSYGQLGVNDTANRTTPVQTFLGGTNWKSVDCGRFHTLAIKTDGTLWGWGRNAYGELGVNNTANRGTPVQTFLGGTNWKQVAGGIRHTTAVKTDGTLWGWGRNNFGQLGVNDTNNRTTPVQTFLGGTNWKQVSCGSDNVSAVTSGTDPTFFIS